MLSPLYFILLLSQIVLYVAILFIFVPTTYTASLFVVINRRCRLLSRTYACLVIPASLLGRVDFCCFQNQQYVADYQMRSVLLFSISMVLAVALLRLAMALSLFWKTGDFYYSSAVIRS